MPDSEPPYSGAADSEDDDYEKDDGFDEVHDGEEYRSFDVEGNRVMGHQI